MHKGATVALLIVIGLLAIGFLAFPFLPVQDGSQTVPVTDMLGDDGVLTWTWDVSANQNHPLSNLELQRTLNFLKARFGFTYDWVAETGELYPGGSGTELNRNYWEAVRESKQLALIPAYSEFEGAEWTRTHATDRRFSSAYFAFLSGVVAAEWSESQSDVPDIPVVGGQRSGDTTVLAVQPVTRRTTVFVNGRRLGPGPVEIVGLPDGARLRLGVYRNGYASLEKWVVVREGQILVLSPRLSKTPLMDRIESYTRYLLGVAGIGNGQTG